MTSLNPHSDGLDARSIKNALDRMRQGSTITESALHRSLWLQLGLDVPHDDPRMFERHMMVQLTRVITEEYNHLRQVVGLAEVPQESTSSSAVAAYEADFTQGNMHLEAWSILYYRYVRVDLSWRVADLARLAGIDRRQITRRTDTALTQMASIIQRYELDTRRAHWQAWLRSKLPPATYVELRGYERIRQDLYDAMLTVGGASVIHLLGPAGSGKTAVAHWALRRAIEEEYIGDFAWVTAEGPQTFEGMLVTLAQSLGYPHVAHLPVNDIRTTLRVLFERRQTIVVWDSAGHLEHTAALLGTLSSVLSGGRLVIISQHTYDFSVPSEVLRMPRLAFAPFAAIIQDIIRRNRIPKKAEDEQAVLHQLYTISQGNPHIAQQLVLEEGFHDGLGTSIKRKAPTPSHRPQHMDMRHEWHHALLDELATTPEGPQQAKLRYELGKVLAWLGEQDEAFNYLRDASQFYGSRGDFIAQATVEFELGQLYLQRGELEQAIITFQRIVGVGKRLSDSAIHQQGVRGLAHIALRVHNIALARTLLDEMGDHRLGGLYSIIRGSIEMADRQPEVAARHYREALTMPDLDVFTHAQTRLRLGLALFQTGDVDAGFEEVEHALEQMQAFGDVFGEARALTNLGTMYAMVDQMDKASQRWSRAVNLLEQFDDPVALAYTLYNIADRFQQARTDPPIIKLFNTAWELAVEHHMTSLIAHMRVHPLFEQRGE